MDNYRYHYYGIKDDQAWRLSCNSKPNLMHWFNPNLIKYSDIVWCQGFRGGVRLVHFNWMKYENQTRKYGYITSNPEAMKEFMWIKLKAKPLN